MIKLKQFVAVVAMGLALIAGSEAAAACAKNQWLNGKKCAACPTNATCNGQIFKCNKNFAQSGAKCIQATCPKGQWMNGKKCAACPANATCKDGRTFTCNKNFALQKNQCVATTCPKGQWMNGKKCATCPANATCKDGRTFTCNKNFALQKNQCVATTCPKGQWMNGSKCAACPANATCKDGRTFTCNKGFTQKGNTCIAATGNCAQNQWYDGKKCQACPANASCNGKTVKCAQNFHLIGNQCLCSGALFRTGKCEPCPKHAICDGRGNYKCEKGYSAGTVHKGKDLACNKLADQNAIGKEGKDGFFNCPKGTGYNFGTGECKKCPEGAERCTYGNDGKIAGVVCAKGYIWPVKNGKANTTKCVKQ